MKILLISNQLEGFANCRLAKRLQSDGHDVRMLESHWYHFLESDEVREYYKKYNFTSYRSFESEYAELYNTKEAVDWEYLQWFEDELCVNKNVHQLMLSDPTLQRHHHHRNLFTEIESDELVYRWVEKLLRWTHGQIESFNPDILFMMNRNQFVKNAAAQIAMATGLEFRTLIHSRVDDLAYISGDFGLGAEERAREYIEDEQMTDEDLSEAVEYMQSFRDSEDGLYKDIMMHWADGDLVEPASEIKESIKSYAIHIKREILNQKVQYRDGFFTRNHFASSTPRLLRFYTRIMVNKLKYRYQIGMSDTFQADTPDGPFIYYPLHCLPESATLTLTDEYHEADIIRYLSKELPVNIRLGVKENPNMVGPRPQLFYSEIAELPNVKLIDPMVPSKKLIRESRGVCGISGTALLEAALMDKPTLAFGQPEFLDVVGHTGRAELDEFVEQCHAGASAKGLDRALRYVQYVFDNGRRMNYDALRYRSPDPDAFEAAIGTVYEMLTAELSTQREPTANA